VSEGASACVVARVARVLERWRVRPSARGARRRGHASSSSGSRSRSGSGGKHPGSRRAQGRAREGVRAHLEAELRREVVEERLVVRKPKEPLAHLAELRVERGQRGRVARLRLSQELVLARDAGQVDAAEPRLGLLSGAARVRRRRRGRAGDERASE
jgi:hypothetical protein